MMDVLTTREREVYEQMWAVDAYRRHSPGERYLPLFLDMVGPSGFVQRSVLDAGCGLGRASVLLHKAGFRVQMCDLTADGLEPAAQELPFTQCALYHDLRKAIGGFVDYVYCTDVIEHIPMSLTLLAVHRMLEVARKGVFLTIAFAPETYGFFIGKPGLHQSLQSFVQWRDQLAAMAHVVEARDLLNFGAFFVEPL